MVGGEESFGTRTSLKKSRRRRKGRGSEGSTKNRDTGKRRTKGN